jgi:hypothetical protein
MTRPRRWRWWGKWATAAITVLLAAVWFASGWVCRFQWCAIGSDHHVGLGIGLGRVCCAYTVSLPDGIVQHVVAWVSGVDGAGVRPLWRWSFMHSRSTIGDLLLVVPLWLPLGLAALPAALLWFGDRRRPPNACPHCRYDLSATPPSAPCPECGHLATHQNAGETTASHQA